MVKSRSPYILVMLCKVAAIPINTFPNIIIFLLVLTVTQTCCKSCQMMLMLFCKPDQNLSSLSSAAIPMLAISSKQPLRI